MISFFVFFQYDSYKHSGAKGEFDHWGEDWNIVFFAFSRFGYALGLSLVFLPPLLGHFEELRWFMGASAWNPFAKMSYAFYLIHYQVINSILNSQTTAAHYNGLNAFLLILISSVISWILAFLLVMFVEAPTMNLERVLLRGQRSAPKPAHSKVQEISLQEGVK